MKQIVINIPDKEYTNIVHGLYEFGDKTDQLIKDIIHNKVTTLEVGHDKLIDIHKLLVYLQFNNINQITIEELSDILENHLVYAIDKDNQTNEKQQLLEKIALGE